MFVGHGVPGCVLEQGVVDGGVVGLVPAPDAEAHGGRDVVREAAERALHFVCAFAEMGERQVGTNRCVTTRDVEADADDGNLVPVRGDAADWHDVADVAVGHERGVFGAGADVLELRECGGIVGAEDFHRPATGDGRLERSIHDAMIKRKGLGTTKRPEAFPMPDSLPYDEQATEDRRDFAHRAARIHRHAVGTIRHPHLTAGPPRSSALVGQWNPAASARSR